MSRPRQRLLATAAAVTVLTVAACGGPSTPTDGPSGDRTSTAPPSTKESSVGFTNPVYAANFPDPQVIATDDGYLAIATNGNGMNVQTLTSSNMVDWQQGTDAMPTLAPWTSSGKVWAPELLEWLDGTWRVYYTTKAPDPQWQCISVGSATQPAGPYTDESTRPLVCQTAEGGSIDASPFVDSTGKAWLYWKNDGNAVGRDTWLYVQQLSADGRGLVGRPVRLFQQTEPWEGHLVEGPAVVEVGGRFHMFYSANDYGSADYAVGHAVASSPTGPFRKDPEPVLTSNDVAAGPGHCQLLQVDGQWWMVYHAWAPDAVGDEATGRQMWLSRATFDGDRATVQPPIVQQPTLP